MQLAKLEALQAAMARLGIREEDLQETFIRAAGPGGQKVNKTSSAVLLKHLPSGLAIKMQVHRSQALNRFAARRLLVLRLEAQQLGAQSAEAARIAKLQRQKRQRSRRAKQRDVARKRAHGDKKAARAKPDRDG